MKSEEVAAHVEAGKRQLRALGKPVPRIDASGLRDRLRVAELERDVESLKPVTQADIRTLLGCINSLSEEIVRLGRKLDKLSRER